MADHVIDTNVLLVASAAHPFSPFDDSDLPVELQQVVFEWLAVLRVEEGRTLVWDDLFKIYEEYRHKLTDQDFGLQVVHEKMATARFVPVTYDADGIAVVPEAFSSFDPSDRKLLAALIADSGGSSLVNATDTDWLEIEEALENAGLSVLQLLEVWLREKYAAKKAP